MAQMTEGAPDLFRLTTFLAPFNLQFSQFLVRDDQPLLFHTGWYRFQFLATPQVPHCWESGLLFEETRRTLLCSDLFHQADDGEPVTQSDVIGRCRDVLKEYQQGPLANSMPYCTLTDPTLRRLAALNPNTLATMHGSVYAGDGAQALHDLAQVFREVLGDGVAGATPSP